MLPWCEYSTKCPRKSAHFDVSGPTNVGSTLNTILGIMLMTLLADLLSHWLLSVTFSPSSCHLDIEHRAVSIKKIDPPSVVPTPFLPMLDSLFQMLLVFWMVLLCFLIVTCLISPATSCSLCPGDAYWGHTFFF